MVQDGGQARLPFHYYVEPDDRRTGGADQRRRGWRYPRRLAPDRIHPRRQRISGKREQYSVGLGIANLDLLDVDPERRRARQHKLVRDVKAPIGAPHGARAREHRRRKPSEFWGAGIGPRHTGAGGRHPRGRDQRRDENREQPPAMPRHAG
jgi:hypothetical protein